MTTSYRDLSIVDLGIGKSLVIACDSTGGIGMKEGDTAKAEPETVGFFSAQVVLMELLSVDAEIVSVANSLSVEMEGYGERLLSGIRDAVESIGLNPDEIINGSTEENFPACMTALGVTAIGLKDGGITKRDIPCGSIIAVLGTPKVGEEILEGGMDEIMTAETMKRLKENISFLELIPAGSKGCLYEIEAFAESRNLEYEFISPPSYDDTRSAGPSTAAAAFMAPEESEKLSAFKIPHRRLGFVK